MESSLFTALLPLLLLHAALAETAAEVGHYIAPRGVEYAVAQEPGADGPVRDGCNEHVFECPACARSAGVASHDAFAEQAVQEGDVFEVKVCDGDERVGWASAFNGKKKAASGRRAAGLVLLLRADPHRPPQRVAAIYVLVSYIVDDAPASCAGIRLDVYSFQRVVESDVDEFAVAHAIDVVVRRD